MKKYLLVMITIITLIFAASLTVHAATFEGSTNTGWSYDESTSTLTLTNYNSTDVISVGTETCQIYSDGDLNIVLKGTNTLNLTSTYGIYVEGNLTISGSGTLSIANATNGIYATKNITVKSGTLSASSMQARGGGITIDNGKINLTGNVIANDGQVAINNGEINATRISAKDIVVANGTIVANVYGTNLVEIKGGNVTSNNGMYVEIYKTLKISGGKVTINGTLDANCWIYFSGGEITITDGIYGSQGSLSVTGGNINVVGGIDKDLNMSNGTMYVEGNVGDVMDSRISGGTLTIKGQLYSGWSSVYISGGTITIESNSYGLYAPDENIVISGGTISIFGQTQALKAGGEIRWSGNCISFLTGSSASNAKVETQYYGEKYVGTTESHSWNSGSITTNPTHLTEGTRTYTCNNCGGRKYESIAKTTAHEYVSWIYIDATNHKRECPCGEIETETHTWSEATCTQKSKCSACASERGDVDINNHTSSVTIYAINALDPNSHDKKHECCGAIIETVAHSGGTATCQEKAKCDICKQTYGAFAEHNFDETSWGYKSAYGHAHICQTIGCSEHGTVVAHTSSGEATKDVAETCTECGYIISPALGHKKHTAKTAWTTDDKYHWHECTGCEGQQLDKSSHKDLDNNAKCDTCGATVPVGTVGEPDEDVNSDGDDLSSGAIAGIAVGSTVVVGIGSFSLIWFVIKKKSWADFLAIFKK